MRPCGNDVEDELALEIDDDNLGTTTGTTFSGVHRIIVPFLVSCGFWPLVHSQVHPCSSQSCLMTRLQACYRGFAPSRRAQDRERIVVLPHKSALLHWPLSQLWCSWTFERVPVPLSLNPFFGSACAPMLWNLPRIISPLVFSRRGWRHSPSFGKRGERGLVPCFEVIDIFPKVPCFSADASFLLQSFLLCPILKFWRTRIAFLRFTLLIIFCDVVLEFWWGLRKEILGHATQLYRLLQ